MSRSKASVVPRMACAPKAFPFCTNALTGPVLSAWQVTLPSAAIARMLLPTAQGVLTRRCRDVVSALGVRGVRRDRSGAGDRAPRQPRARRDAAYVSAGRRAEVAHHVDRHVRTA